MTPTPEPAAESGRLRARLETPSHQLQRTLPIEVRNSHLALVTTTTHGKTVDLARGWYEVSAVLDDGHRHATTLEISPGQVTDVTLRVEVAELMPENSVAPDWVERFHALEKKDVFGSRGPGDESVPSPFQIEFTSAEGATLSEQTPERWLFDREGSRSPDRVPVAHLRIDGEEYRVSLPVNPLGYYREAACVMTFKRHRHGAQIRAGFHPDRLVSTAIQNMVEEGELAHATQAAEQTAEDMLRDKYQDPVGATLGAMILFRAGILAKRVAWLRNLQRDFDWLPDGKIMLATLPGASDEAETADLLLRAAAQRPLFTESFSILFDALRRWSSTHRNDEIAAAFTRVASVAKRVDWTTFTLTDRPQ